MSESLEFKSRSQIAQEYGIHRDTLRRLLKRYDIKLPRGLVSPKDQSIIRNAIGQVSVESSG